MPGMLAFCPDGTNDPVRLCFGTKAARMGTNDSWVRPSYIVSHELPDLTDPATVGCLLALVREACSKPAVTMFWGDYWQVVYASKVEDGCADNEHLGSGDTEAEALVAALEAAP